MAIPPFEADPSTAFKALSTKCILRAFTHEHGKYEDDPCNASFHTSYVMKSRAHSQSALTTGPRRLTLARVGGGFNHSTNDIWGLEVTYGLLKKTIFLTRMAKCSSPRMGAPPTRCLLVQNW
ncbi:hypothetical protein CIPAW_01G203100 [Carya illinoinensis]|uniref:Uncharacterized protein n=1 Tax=Carya illinoinensis TaxID=32201 RepID=A0A8T1RPT7_CARIL|nr:hypothetical protein CIPAW_01G203100 [Carya illinoinensis]